MSSLEVRLYQAWRTCRGIRLSAKEVQALIGRDEAVQTRITDAIAEKLGGVAQGAASPALFGSEGSIRNFQKEITAAQAAGGE